MRIGGAEGYICDDSDRYKYEKNAGVAQSGTARALRESLWKRSSNPKGTDFK